jgi:hypothetical protein
MDEFSVVTALPMQCRKAASAITWQQYCLLFTDH